MPTSRANSRRRGEGLFSFWAQGKRISKQSTKKSVIRIFNLQIHLIGTLPPSKLLRRVSESQRRNENDAIAIKFLFLSKYRLNVYLYYYNFKGVPKWTF